jgi:sugar lactone lactonase YvrE
MTFDILAHPMAITGECPLWDADRGCLWWLDIQAQRLLRTTTDGTTTAIATPWQPGLVALAASGRLVLGLEDGLWALDPEAVVWERLSDTEADRPTLRLNDGKPDAAGRLWFGSMDMTGTGQAIGRLYRRDPDGAMHVIREGVTVPNAIAPFADGTGLWFTDTTTRRLERLHTDPVTGSVLSGETVLTFDEGVHPDGGGLDAEGHLWLATVGPGEVWQIDATGNILSRHPGPVTRMTMALLGGPSGSTLFVTNQRRFLDPAGLAGQPFAGALLHKSVAATAGPVHRVAGA